ncbi:helix-hairpin-helix domain-containing protein [Halalkalicoccus sp. NIPERK01]|uniref:helix-hairpin-helix domain-containing protein n=1 Tax=Halalkalicoccus sp. NIPERK01 TaxID=3053469 RepID=UPI00256F1255|nr:helix-hairpin-helix domain-containing protein [Halalkalicoccus sp. NIPERK01]MDL5362843.1 endonuclease MutS2 [Halalkalicoccus sp. NIPERK01]
MEFESIPGVGAKTASALAEVEDAERALREGDVAALAGAPGISEGRAARIARGAIRREHDDSSRLLRTDRAREIHRELLALLQDRAVTSYAKRRLETFYPSAARSRIEEVRGFAERALEREPDPEVREALAGVEPLEAPREVRVRERCLVTSDAETLAAAREAIPELPVEVVEDARGLADLARGYSTVIALDEAFTGVEVEGDVRVRPDALSDPAEVVPERTLSFFAANRASIRAAIAVHRAAGLDPPCDLAALDDALSRLGPDGEVKDDAELERLTRAVDDLDASVHTAESVANDSLKNSIEKRDVTIEGTDLLSLAERGAGIDSLLSRELADEYAAAVEAAREHLIDALALDSGESEIARDAFPEEPTFPVEHDESVVGRLREELVAAKERRAMRGKRELAADLADLREPAEALVRAALDLDVELALSRFSREFDCTMPDFSGVGIEIEGGRSPLLSEPLEAIEPVDYSVSGVTLLSGVNSGGKTSTLDLVCAVVILAQMGLPVPADRVRLERFSEVHYHAKTQGTLDAGAFEGTVKEFAGLASGGEGRLVLVDELESITEPGASAKIIAGILEALCETDTTAIFVSHLAREIRTAADCEIRVDGIEAVGLVDGDLVVNRSPVRDHLARSTPELIVEKLAREEGTAIYDRLLGKFES